MRICWYSIFTSLRYDNTFLECDQILLLPSLHSNLSCHLGRSCTQLDCCVYVPLLNRTFSFYVDVNPCYEKFTVGIEKMYRKCSLLSYDFGSTQHFNLLGIFKLQYAFYCNLFSCTFHTYHVLRLKVFKTMEIRHLCNILCFNCSLFLIVFF